MVAYNILGWLAPLGHDLSSRRPWRQGAAAWLLAMSAAGLSCSPVAWSQTARPAEAVSTIKAYPVAAAELQSTAADWKAAFANRGEVRIAIDTRRNQLLVVASPDVHQSIADRLGSPLAKIAPVDPNLLTLRNISWKDFEHQLRRVGFVSEGAQTGDVARYKLKLTTGADALISVARNEGTVKLTAPKDVEPALRKLTVSLDKPTPKAGEIAQVVSFDKAEPAKVNKLLGWLQAAARPTNPASGKHTHIGDYVSLIFQPAEQPAAQPAAAQPPAQPSGAQPGGAQPGTAQPGAEVQPGEEPVDAGPLADLGRINNVQIEYIEGLDMLILRGRKADVDRVMRLIEQIELQSQTTRPEVEIFYLRNVDGRALNDLVTQVYDQIFTARQGRVTIVPLVKPNALLLIGRKENLPGVKDLLEKLDHPVAPDTQLRVYPLNFITADAALTIVNNFFVDRTGGTTGGAAGQQRPGLGTRVNAVSDGRTNSLIVQAAPRDLEEVGELLKRLDIEESPKKSHMRIVKLRNSLADELVPVIESAIGGTAGTGGGGGGNQQPANAPGAQTGPTTNQGASGGGSGARGTSLQLLRSDGKLVESGILADVTLTSDPRGNSIIITGPEKSMDLVEELIKRLDELPATEAQIKVFTIVNGDATQLADLLRQLFGQATGTQGGNQGLQALLQSATGGGDSALVPLRFSVDVRTNSIVASGSSGDLNVVYKVLVRLDEGNIRERITTVYRLRNAPALEVATALQQLRQFQQQLNQQTQTLNTATQTLEREVIVVPEQVSNSLIVSATPRYFDEIRRVVEELDRRPNMVVIQVLLAEVLLDDFNEFGIELGLQDSLLFDRGVAGAGAAGVGRIGFPFNQAGIGNDNTAASLATRESVAGQALSNFGVGRATADATFGGLVLSAGNESVNVLIRALQTSARLQVLSRPQVQTLDNQPAYVQIGQQVPYITSSNQTQFGIQNQTTFQDVGVILGVTPRTSPDGMIVMEIDAVKSSLDPGPGITISVATDPVTGVTTPIDQPIINVTRAQTTVSARSGQTVILGGLIDREQSEITRRVPYLGDIPVLGRLFRFDSVNVQRRELLIIMTPYVMRTDEHVAWLNMRESERMHWCLADVANVHGNAQHFTSSADPGIHTPVIFPDETPAPEGLIAPEDLSGRVPSTMISPAQPGDPNYYPGLPQVSPDAAPPSSIQPGAYPPGANPPGNSPGYLPTPPPVPNQSSRRQLQPTPAAPPPGAQVSAPRHSILPASGPLQALPPVPQGAVPYGPVPPGLTTQGPTPAQLVPPGPLAPPPYAVQPAGAPQQTATPGQVAPAQFTPPYGQQSYVQQAYGPPQNIPAPPPKPGPGPNPTYPNPNFAPAGR